MVHVSEDFIYLDFASLSKTLSTVAARNMEGDENLIGARFESDGYYGTIRFKGQVADTKGTV